VAGGAGAAALAVRRGRLLQHTFATPLKVSKGIRVEGHPVGVLLERTFPSGMSVLVGQSQRPRGVPRLVIRHPKLSTPMVVKLLPEGFGTPRGWIHPALGLSRYGTGILSRRDMLDIARVTSEAFPQAQGFASRRLRGDRLRQTSGLYKLPFAKLRPAS
jgi:hypothetical protein